jgi:anaerobic selenocysteine-containing dehydrogenase
MKNDGASKIKTKRSGAQCTSQKLTAPEIAKLTEKLSFCRICMGSCGTVVTVDEKDRIVAIRGDHDDSQTLGYACFKGMRAGDAHNSPDRILRPLKRMEDGSFQPIPLEQALDEISSKIADIRDAHGADALAGYKGGGGVFTASASMLLSDWLETMGSRKAFSSATIDQSAKYVSAGRLGTWPAGRTPFNRGDVFMIVGGNPLVSLTAPGFDTRNPAKRLRDAKARGMKLIIIDPRETETAKFADVFLQPLPGEDPTVLAGLLHIIFAAGWEDRAFCERHVADLEALKLAVSPFTPDYVAVRADVPVAKLYEVAEVFALQSHTGSATSSTGPDMSAHSNLAEHLVECLNIVCGRFVREGEPVDNPGVLNPRWPRKAQVSPAARWWENGYKSRIGNVGMIFGELPTGVMADEILTPGEGQVRFLMVHGGNPAAAVPGQHHIVKALKSLDLLVTIDPFMTVTAQLSHYILPPKMPYERPDLPLFLYETMIYPEPYTRYTPAVCAVPENSDLADDTYIFWSLAKRLGVKLRSWGVDLDMDAPPSVDDFLKIGAQHLTIPFAELQAMPRGGLVPGEAQVVEPADADAGGRFTVAPADVLEEIQSVIAEANKGALRDAYPYRIAVRRQRDVINSAMRDIPLIRKRLPYNVAYLNPADVAAEGLQEDDRIDIISEAGSITTRVKLDPTIRRGVVSITHGFGGLPGDGGDFDQDGANTNLLIDPATPRESINAMPRMSGIPVTVRARPN